MLLEAYRVLAGKASKGAKESIYKNGFFFGSGVFAGITLNDLFRLSGSNVNYEKVKIANAGGIEVKDVNVDEMLQYALVTAAVITSVVTGKYVKEVIPMAAGALTGIAWANQSERGGNAITILPF